MERFITSVAYNWIDSSTQCVSWKNVKGKESQYDFQSLKGDSFTATLNHPQELQKWHK